MTVPLLPQGTFGNVWGQFWLSQLGGRAVLVVPSMLLNLLPRTGSPLNVELSSTEGR